MANGEVDKRLQVIMMMMLPMILNDDAITAAADDDYDDDDDDCLHSHLYCTYIHTNTLSLSLSFPESAGTGGKVRATKWRWYSRRKKGSKGR